MTRKHLVVLLALGFTACGTSKGRGAISARERVSPTTEILRRSDGSARAVISAGPRFFRDDRGQWQNIALVVERAPDGSLVSHRNLLRARFPQALGGPTPGAIRFEDRATGYGLSFLPMHAVATGSAMDGVRAVRYSLGALAPGSYEEFRLLPGAVKHDLVLGEASAVDRLLVSLGDGLVGSVVRVRLDEGVRLEPDGEGLRVVGTQGLVFRLPPPRAYELAGGRRSIPARYRWDPARGTLAVEVSEDWIRDPARAFPLALDPPATVFASAVVTALGTTATGPGNIITYPQLRLGHAASEYYQLAMKFDLSGIALPATVTGVAANVFFSTNGTTGSQTFNFARLTKDPEISDPASLFADGVEGAQPNYATFSSANACDCWVNGGNPATLTGTALGGSAVGDVQAALAGPRTFLLGLHLPSYTVQDRYAIPHGLMDANGPQLYVDYTGGPPTVGEVTPASIAQGPAATVTVRGTGFIGGAAGTTFVLSPVGGGADVPVTATYASATMVSIAVPPALASNVYDVVATTLAGVSAKTASDRLGVTTLKTWNGLSSSSWSAGANWSPIGAPTAASRVVIPAAPFACALDVAASVASVQVTGGSLSLTSNSLQVGSDLVVGSGTLALGTGIAAVTGNFIHTAGTLSADTGTLQFVSRTPGRRSFLGRGDILVEDFETGAPGWVASTVSGSPIPWVAQDRVAASSHVAFYQAGQQITAGVAALTSPPFDLTGKASAALRWKHRFRISLENRTGPATGDGYVVEASVNGGSSWISIAPTPLSVAPTAGKSSTAPGNTITPATAGLFAGIQNEWVEETASLTGFVGYPSVLVRFVAGWDNDNDFNPWDGVYVDEVKVVADEAPLLLHHLELNNAAQVSSLTGLQLTGNLSLTTAGNLLDLGGKGLSASGLANNVGTLIRGLGGGFSIAGAFDNGGTFRMGTGDVTVGATTNAGSFVGGVGSITAASLTTSGSFSSGDGSVNVGGDLVVTGPAKIVGPLLGVAGNLSNASTLQLGNATLSLTSAALSTVSGSGAYRQTAHAPSVFFDGFESGSFTAGGWVASSTSTPPDPLVVTAPVGVGAGTYVANLSAGDQWINNWLTKTFNTTGLSDVWLSYGHRSGTGGGTNELRVEISANGGATWTTAVIHPGSYPYTTSALSLSAIDPAVDNNPNFQFRFHSYRTNVGTYHYVDDVALKAGTDGVGDLTVSGAGTKRIDPASGAFKVNGALSLDAGVLQIAPGRTFSIDNLSPLSSASGAGTVLDVEPGATLKLSANTSLQLGGALELVGTSGAFAKVTSTDTGTPGRYSLTVSGAFRGSYFDLDYANALGLRLASGCQVAQLDHGAFHHPSTNGALLTLESATLPVSAGFCAFENEASALNAANVDGSGTTSSIQFNNATGTLAGEAFDRDFGGVTPGNIVWATLPPGVATQLAFTSQPDGGAAGVPMTPAVVEVRDVFDDVVAGSTASVALALGNNPGGGSLTVVSPQTAVAGVATFAGVAVDQPGAGYTLVASSPGLNSATSAPFDIGGSAGPPSPLTLNVGCGCGSTGLQGGGWVALLLAVGAIRLPRCWWQRRRHPRRHPQRFRPPR